MLQHHAHGMHRLAPHQPEHHGVKAVTHCVDSRQPVKQAGRQAGVSDNASDGISWCESSGALRDKQEGKQE
jgi:hypothetical protein